VIRDEDRGARNSVDGLVDGEGAPANMPGGAAAYKRWRMRNNLKNLILHRITCAGCHISTPGNGPCWPLLAPVDGQMTNCMCN
jgi:hypothetical protein